MIRQTEKTDCLTPSRMRARGNNNALYTVVECELNLDRILSCSLSHVTEAREKSGR